MSKVVITLPDGAKREFAKDSSALDIAKNIAPSLAKATLVAKIDGELRDLSTVIDKDCRLEFINREHDDALEVLRHDCAHVLAEAVQSLFPNTQITFGPAIENGLYYDFYRETPFTPDDFPAIEQKMREIIDQNQPFTREVWQRDQAATFFKQQGESFKAEHVMRLPEGDDISIYRQGEWLDLCRGPHMPSTGKLGKAFKLMRVSGAYWLGDQNNPQLQRIYATCWRNEKELNAYLTFLEEAEKRDHRKLGKQLDFFHMQDDAPGMVFWHPKGWALWQQIEQYMRQMFIDYDYQEVRTPSVLDKSLWEKSGHWQNYHDNMFVTASENREYAVKPMNCPGHIQIFNSHLHSYRDLPMRLAEFGSCHRNEPSGALHGLMRVRGFTQDDAHIFCTEEQVESEVADFIKMLYKAYGDFGFNEVLVKLSTRPEKRIGSDEEWDRAEKSLANALKANNLDFEYLPGEGAFYGPKIEFTLKDSLGRLWQCGTVQLDPNLPERLGAEYVAEDNSRKRPVMLHRAIVGSMERFMGILIENHAGAMPVWLSPVQVAVLNISDAQADYVVQVVETLKKSGIRCEFDLRNEKITYKIREHSLQKLPYLLLAGDREMQAGFVAVRTRKGEDLGSMPIEAFIERIQAEIKAKV
ncbi:MAG: threonine--tRNA ligase [Betaproteobacteria bacterium]|nr:threonine--tRNA ligase [Betaproteobacteria bacterium]